MVVGAVVPLLADVEDLEVIAVAFLCRGQVKRITITNAWLVVRIQCGRHSTTTLAPYLEKACDVVDVVSVKGLELDGGHTHHDHPRFGFKKLKGLQAETQERGERESESVHTYE